jgi:hypothetical protein
MILKIPKIYRKIVPKLKNDLKLKNDKKLPIKFTSLTSSSYPGFIYLRASHRT